MCGRPSFVEQSKLTLGGRKRRIIGQHLLVTSQRLVHVSGLLLHLRKANQRHRIVRPDPQIIFQLCPPNGTRRSDVNRQQRKSPTRLFFLRKLRTRINGPLKSETGRFP